MHKRSMYTGVSWHAPNNKWLSQMLVKGKQENLGFFKEEKDAAQTYDAKKRELRKEGVVLKNGFKMNFPTEEGEKQAKKRKPRKKKGKAPFESLDSGTSDSDSVISVTSPLISLSPSSEMKVVTPLSANTIDADLGEPYIQCKSNVSPLVNEESLFLPVAKVDNFSNTKARELALENNVNVESLIGTGKNGKITSADVKKVLVVPKKHVVVEVPKYVDGLPKLVTDMATLSCKVREKFPFGGKESHYQGAMESELQEAGYMVQHEVGELYHYEKMNGEVIRLPHDIRSREDLLLPREKMVLELKAIPALKGKDHCQLLRYMEERRKSSWGEQTIGMLINYGDNDMEIWYMFYKGTRPQRVLILHKSIEPFTSFIDSFVC